MVVVEHEPTALLVGVEVGADTITRLVGDAIHTDHVGHVAEGDTLLVGGGITSGGEPLVGRAVTDPGVEATVKVELTTVLGEGGPTRAIA